MSEADFVKPGDSVPFTSVGAVVAGDVIQLPDGRAAVTPSAVAAAGSGEAAVCGVFDIDKTANQIILPGQPVFWDSSASKATVVPDIADADFFLGSCVPKINGVGAAGADTKVRVELNANFCNLIDLSKSGFLSVPVFTAAPIGGRMVGGGYQMLFTAANEAQKVDALSVQGFDVESDWIFWALVNIVTNGTSVTDFNLGVANATHATDADSITESCFVHIDGGSTNLLVESDDGTTEVAAEDSTIDFVAGTPFVVAIDGRVTTALRIYINGIEESGASTLRLDNATGPLKALAHVEKTMATEAFNALIMGLKVWTMDL